MHSPRGQRPAISIFVSYAHSDFRMQRRLLEALAPLRSHPSFTISEWFDGLITGGTEWEQEIKTQLQQADIILLLISPDFIESQYCYEKELEWALERHRDNEVLVIPVLLRPVAFRGRKFSPIQAIPRRGPEPKPIERWKPRSEGWEATRTQLQKAISDYLDRNVVMDALQQSRSI